MPKLPRGFVLDLTHKLAEGGVEDRAGQLGFRKSLHAQILDADQVVLARQAARQVVQKIAPLVGHFAMHFGHAVLCFLSATTSWPLSRQSFLSFLEFAAPLPGEPGSRNPLAIGENEQVLESEVHADWLGRSGRLKRSRGDLELGSQGNVPVSASVSLERRALRRALERAGLADADPADLRNVDFALFDLDPLGDTESEVSGFSAAKPGKAATLLEERIESPVYILESLLEHLRVGLFKPVRIRLTLDGRQLRGKFSGGDAFAVFSVVAFTSVESPIVDEPTGSGHPVQSGLLSLRGAHPEPVDLSQQHVRGSILEMIRNTKTVSLARLRGDSSSPLKREAFSP